MMDAARIGGRIARRNAQWARPALIPRVQRPMDGGERDVVPGNPVPGEQCDLQALGSGRETGLVRVGETAAKDYLHLTDPRDAEYRQWVLTRLGELALRMGDKALAAMHFKEAMATGVVSERQILELLDIGIAQIQGPHIAAPGPVRPDLMLERPKTAAPVLRRADSKA